MMKKISKRLSVKWFVAASAVMISVISCQKHYDPNFTLPHQFKPGNIDITTAQTQATLQWSASLFSGSTTSYTFQVSQDSTFAGTMAFNQSVTATTVVLTDSILKPRQSYFARVKANAVSSTAESGWVTSAKFSITGQQIFLTPASSDIIDNSVLLKWKPTNGLTTIVITPQSGTAITVNLTQADLTALQKIISGLSGSTKYSAEIFAGTVSKGYLTFMTAAPLSGNLVDLRGIDGRPSVLSDTLPLIPDNSTVILKRGQTYAISAALNLGQSVTIISGADLTNPNQAVVSLPANFNITAGSTIDHIIFQDVYLLATDYTSKYVFNISNACTIGSIDFESCRIENMRGICRLQTAVITLSKYIINNCIVDSISNYGLITIDNANCKADNISIKNSTIYKTERGIISTKQTAGSTSIVIDQCTFNEAPQANNTASFVVDYKTFNVTNGVSITNCIFGVAKPNGATLDASDIRVGTSTTVTSTNNYVTSDHVASTFPLTPVISYSGVSTSLWQDPTNGNFKFADNSFAGKNSAGDPRWR